MRPQSPTLAAQDAHPAGGPPSGRARVRRGLQGSRGRGFGGRPWGLGARGQEGERGRDPGGSLGGESGKVPGGRLP